MWPLSVKPIHWIFNFNIDFFLKHFFKLPGTFGGSFDVCSFWGKLTSSSSILYFCCIFLPDNPRIWTLWWSKSDFAILVILPHGYLFPFYVWLSLLVLHLLLLLNYTHSKKLNWRCFPLEKSCIYFCMVKCFQWGKQLSWGYCIFLFSVPFIWTALPQCLYPDAGPRLRVLDIAYLFMPAIHSFHLKFVSLTFFLLDLQRLSLLTKGPAMQQKLCFIQSCVFWKQDFPLQKPGLQWYLNQCSLVLAGFHLFSSKLL